LFFMPPRSKIGVHIVFILSVILSFNSVIHQNFNLGYNFWMVSTTVLIFHMGILCDKTFPWVQNFLTLWPWPWCLIYLLKSLTLPISLIGKY
jgi:hypothetical protein